MVIHNGSFQENVICKHCWNKKKKIAQIQLTPYIATYLQASRHVWCWVWESDFWQTSITTLQVLCFIWREVTHPVAVEDGWV